MTHLSGCSALYFLYLSSPHAVGPMPPPTPPGTSGWDSLGVGEEGGTAVAQGRVRSPRRGPASLMTFGLLCILCIPVRCTGHLYGPALVGWAPLLVSLGLWGPFLPSGESWPCLPTLDFTFHMGLNTQLQEPLVQV